MCDAETGRFLSVDPLFESFDAHTPYHYAYNSPIKYKDPSGLAPERDEKVEKTQAMLIDGKNVGLMFLIGMQLIAELDDLAERFAKEDAMYEAEADALFEQRNAIIGGNKDGGGGRDSKDEAKNGNPKADDDKEGNRQKKIKEPDTGSEDNNSEESSKGKKKLNDVTEIFNKKIEELKIFFREWANDYSWHAYPQKLLDFKDKAKTNSILDLKNNGFGINDIGELSIYDGKIYRYEDYGNMAFGIISREIGISCTHALMGAGLYHVYEQTIKRSEMPGLNSLNIFGFGDDWRDSYMIVKGYYFMNK